MHINTKLTHLTMPTPNVPSNKYNFAMYKHYLVFKLQTIRYNANNHEIDYVAQLQDNLKPKGFKNHTIALA